MRRGRPPRPFDSYVGCKDASSVCEHIAALMPRHSVYVEPFLGNGAVLRCKLPALRSIGIDRDAEVIERWEAFDFPGLELVRADALAWLRAHGPHLPADAVVYLDPPYPLGVVKGRRLYRYQLTDAQHEQLLALAASLPCSVFISSYWSRVYASKLAGWQHTSFQAATRGGVRTEHVWYKASIAGFGGATRSAGTGFRERERIKRKVARWVGKFTRTQRVEREAILTALLDAHRARSL